MRVELEDNLNNNLMRFFKELNKYNEEFYDIQYLLEYLTKRMKKDNFEFHQQVSFSLRNTMFTFHRIDYLHNTTINYTINVIVDEETLKVLGVNRIETKTYNEMIF